MPASPVPFQGSFRNAFDGVRGRSLAVAVSGGVDSLCALVLAKAAGFDVTALHALFCRDANDPGEAAVLEGLEAACSKLGIPLKIADLREEFQAHVARPFAEAYLNGLTPNPCTA
ncbi:MAG: hypothetical protein II515_01260, partial [Desulfovibrio sp.]|nr:hypothetical protein [Desulfovibrio sp.]